jgi:hypothetical protein
MINQISNFSLGISATNSTASIFDSINHNKFLVIDKLMNYIISIVGAILAPIIIALFKKKSGFEIKGIFSVLSLRFMSLLSPYQARIKAA